MFKKKFVWAFIAGIILALRAKKIFGQSSTILVSQNNSPLFYRVKLWLRERLARVLAVYDVVMDSDPKYLGDPIVIE